MIASWLYQNLPLFYFVLNFFLHYRVGDDLQSACYGFSARLGESGASKDFLTLFLAYKQHLKVARNKA